MHPALPRAAARIASSRSAEALTTGATGVRRKPAVDLRRAPPSRLSLLDDEVVERLDLSSSVGFV
jgi:hypothetical protein